MDDAKKNSIGTIYDNPYDTINKPDKPGMQEPKRDFLSIMR